MSPAIFSEMAFLLYHMSEACLIPCRSGNAELGSAQALASSISRALTGARGRVLVARSPKAHAAGTGAALEARVPAAKPIGCRLRESRCGGPTREV